MNAHQQVRQELPELFKVQRAINNYDNEVEDYPWYRSALLSAAELVSFCGLQGEYTGPHGAIKTRLVGLFSRLLSEQLQITAKKQIAIELDPANLEFLASSYSRVFTGERSGREFNRLLDEFIGACATGHHIPVHKFFGLCHCLELSWDELKSLYLTQFDQNSWGKHAA